MKKQLTKFLIATLLLPFLVIGCGYVIPSALPPISSTETGRGSASETNLIESHFVDYEEACIIGEMEQKPVLLFFTTKNCPYSRQLMTKTIRMKEISELLDNFVCVQIDATERKDLCTEYAVNGFPTIQFLSYSKVPMQRLAGQDALAVDNLSIQMHAALRSMASVANKNATVEPANSKR